MAVHLVASVVLTMLSSSYAAPPAPAPGVPKPCFLTRTQYEPLDMKGSSKTNTARAEDCQERCRTTADCVHFSWFDDGGCHLQDAQANRARGTKHALSGPTECASGNFCFKNGVKFDKMNMPGHGRTETISTDDCQSRCANTDGCASFVWYPDGGCHIQDRTAKPVQAAENIVSGGADCEPTTTMTTTSRTTTTVTTTSSITTTQTSTQTTTTTNTTTTSSETTTTRTSTITTTTLSSTSTNTSSTSTQTKTTTTSSTSSSTSSRTSTKTSSTSTKTKTTTTSSTSSSTSSTTSPPDMCLLPSLKFVPIDMTGAQRTEESSPYLCQARCRKQHGCAHFSWWARDGGCHLQDGAAKQEAADIDVLTGPPDCNLFAYCFENRHKFKPLQMVGQTRTEAKSPTECQSRCQKTRGCKHFTFWSDGGCHIQDANALREAADNNVVSGPVTCDAEWKSTDGFLPGGSNMFIGHMTPDQAKMRCLNMGCKGFTYKGDSDETGQVKVFIKSEGRVDEASVGTGWVSFSPKGLVLADEGGEHHRGNRTEEEEEDSQDRKQEQREEHTDGHNTSKDVERLFADDFLATPGTTAKYPSLAPSFAAGVPAMLVVAAAAVALRSRLSGHGLGLELIADEAPDVSCEE